MRHPHAWILAALLGCGEDPAEPAADAAVDAAPPPCEGAAGTFHAQILDVGGEPRFYFLHVPAEYDCATAWPLLVDFHGTGGGAEPEILYKNDELVALADAEGFLAVRPRSRFSAEPGFGDIYRWDQNPGDLERNVAFTHALVEELASRYHLDRARLYASGFSSGSNMAMQFLADEPRLFAGLGLVAGGAWTPPAAVTVPERAYLTTGYRDYLWFAAADSLALLGRAGLPAGSAFLRESDTGHELYGWHFEELWAWLDRGERPPAGVLAGGWTREESGAQASFVELAPAPDGALVAAAADGAVWRRAGDGAWSWVGAHPAGAALSGVTVCPSGRGLAVGGQTALATEDGGLTWSAATAPPGLDANGFDPAYLNGVACGAGGRLVGVGYWAGLTSGDGGDTWNVASVEAAFGVSAQGAAVAAGPSGTWLAVGYYDYLGRSADGVTFAPVATPGDREWWNAAAARGTRWILVGEGGAIALSSDDGQGFEEVAVPRSDDLYAVAWADDATALAVGAHGAALLTSDAGATWRDVSTGLDLFLGGVVFLDAETAVVVGEGGTALRFTVPP